MQLNQLMTDDDAVSPVIGVILMVAITVILAAVIGAFVLGFGGGGPSAPTTNWDSTENTSSGEVHNVTFEVTSTDQFDASTLEVSVGDETEPVDIESQVSAGSSIEVNFHPTATPELNGGDEIELIWSEEGSSSTVATHTLSNTTTGSPDGINPSI